MQRSPTGEIILQHRDLPLAYCLRPEHRREEKNTWAQLSFIFLVYFRKKPKSKSKLHNTPNGLLSQLPLFQFSLWRMSARAMLQGLAGILKSERISILLSRGYSDKLVCKCCLVNKVIQIGFSQLRLRCCLLSYHTYCSCMLKTKNSIKKRFILITLTCLASNQLLRVSNARNLRLGDRRYKWDVDPPTLW